MKTTSFNIRANERNLLALSRTLNCFESWYSFKDTMESNYDVTVHLPIDYPYIQDGENIELHFRDKEECINFKGTILSTLRIGSNKI